jgi:hypothetical protein
MINGPDKKTPWEERIARYRSSGLSGLKWCKENHVAYSTFNYWLTRIVQGRLTRPLKATITQSSFTELKDHLPYDTVGVEIVIGKATIRLHKGFDEVVLRSCLYILGG